MLAIKHVTGSGEALYQGSEVIYLNGAGDANAIAATAAEQLQYLDGKEWKSLRFGVVYVMNDAGKTVATYDMNRLGVQSAAGIVGPEHGVAFGLVGSNIRAA